MHQNNQDTIIALATSSGVGAIAVIRLSGKNAIIIVNKFFRSKFGKKDLNLVKTHTIHLGNIVENDRIIDEVLVSVFKNPNSYTGENVVEISCHGSAYIQQEILQLFLKNGVRHADAGEFTLRAFIHGKMDLSQAEAVADLIASDSKASHQIAMQQMRGGFSNEIASLREQLLNFASLIELELDFSEEDVEFADRKQFQELIIKITRVLKNLIDSFAVGNVLKNGIPVAIVGEPTLMHLAIAEKGLLVLDCYAHGIAGHAAHGLGENSIYKAMEAIKRIKNFRFPKVSETLGKIKMTVTQINAGNQHNVIPAVCHFVVDIRVTDQYSNLEVLDIIKQNLNIEVKVRSLNLNSSSISKQHAIVQAGVKMGREIYGSPTLSDQSNLTCPSLKLGPGDSHRSHTADEFIYIDEVVDGIKLYVDLLMRVICEDLKQINK